MERSRIKRRPLTDTTLNSLEPEDKDYRELDEQGLYFRVKANGSKSWKLRFKRLGWLDLGGFPDRTDKAARKEPMILER